MGQHCHGPNLLWAEMSTFPAAYTSKQVQPSAVVIRAQPVVREDT